eukprot:7987092-Pyramimonas_sp.AAC.1
MSRTLSKVHFVPCLRGVGTNCIVSVGRRCNLYLGCASLPIWTYPPICIPPTGALQGLQGNRVPLPGTCPLRPSESTAL